jgi:peptidyl-prolyl cis-trans isomerase SurA
LLAVCLASPFAHSRVIDRIAAVVNSEVILLTEVDKRCQAALDRIRALDVLIDEMLIRQQTREHKVEVTDKDVVKQIDQIKKDNNLNDKQFVQALKMEGRTLDDLKRDIRKQMERSKLIEVQMRNNPEMRSQVQIGEQDIAEYYRSHYNVMEKVRASHILFAAPTGTKREQLEKTRGRAQQILKKIRTGAPFDQMAKQHSEDPSASLGGDLGWFRRGDMVAAFEKAAFGLKKGAVSDLVQTQFGFHIIKVTDRAEEDRPDLNKVRPRIQQQLYRDKFGRAMRGWLDDLRRRSFVDIKL